MSSDTLKNISIVQSGAMIGNLDVDLPKLLQLFREAVTPDTDLVIFPELCNTPYFGATSNENYKSWAEPLSGPSILGFATTARELGTAVIMGFYELGSDGKLYNSAVVIDAYGNLVTGHNLDGDEVPTYRKTSLPQNPVGGVPVNEKYFFTEGSGPAVFDIAGMRIACLICYDRTFPEYWLGSLALGAEVIIPLVSSLGNREKLFLQELQIRAMETQTWVLAANRGGKETIDGTTVSYFGLSCAVDPDGEIVEALPAHTHGDILRTRIDLGHVQESRIAFPLSRDRIPGILIKTGEAFAATAQKMINA